MNETGMGSENRAAARSRRPRSSPSAGLPGDELSADERLRELETRLGRIEGRSRYRERGRHLLDRIMPPEASRHFRNAGREELLGIRSIVDFWINRIDDAEDRASPESTGRQRIDVS
ncbi:MAG TPA: hypothetical protein VHS36_01705 [Candidatus Limnocylindrales bacterium]|jgi:hypothetical protein|nr:hypothetical protein [Candidatus Limnocylindrales bacterium]